MAMTMSGTTLTFNDSTTQTTAASAVNSFMGIGEAMMLLGSYSSIVIPGDSVSGSYLYRNSTSTGNGIYTWYQYFYNAAGNFVNTTTSPLTSIQYGTIVNTSGTWRYVGAGRVYLGTVAVDSYGATSTTLNGGIFRRIS